MSTSDNSATGGFAALMKLDEMKKSEGIELFEFYGEEELERASESFLFQRQEDGEDEEAAAAAARASKGLLLHRMSKRLSTLVQHTQPPSNTSAAAAAAPEARRGTISRALTLTLRRAHNI